MGVLRVLKEVIQYFDNQKIFLCKQRETKDFSEMVHANEEIVKDNWLFVVQQPMNRYFRH